MKRRYLFGFLTCFIVLIGCSKSEERNNAISGTELSSEVVNPIGDENTSAESCEEMSNDVSLSSGDVQIVYDLAQDISNYHVVVVEDIIDTGRTLLTIADMLKARNPLSLKILTLLDKPERRVVDLSADYSLFTIPDYYIVGYGLDFGEYYRNLPYIAEYDPE